MFLLHFSCIDLFRMTDKTPQEIVAGHVESLVPANLPPFTPEEIAAVNAFAERTAISLNNALSFSHLAAGKIE